MQRENTGSRLFHLASYDSALRSTVVRTTPSFSISSAVILPQPSLDGPGQPEPSAILMEKTYSARGGKDSKGLAVEFDIVSHGERKATWIVVRQAEQRLCA
jgi:hypothetical protein